MQLSKFRKKLAKWESRRKFRTQSQENRQKWENFEEKTGKIDKNGNSGKNQLLKSLRSFSRKNGKISRKKLGKLTKMGILKKINI